MAELLVARLLFALRRHTGNHLSFDARFGRERGLIRALLRNCDEQTGRRRVLIQRLRGLEDSSRYWSMWMTLDHLRIVHLGFARIIDALSRGIVPGGQASTAAVKPDPWATGAVVAPYEKSCDALLASVAGAPDLNTAVRYPHPWFGPLNATGWHALAGMHLGLHRFQIERIRERL